MPRTPIEPQFPTERLSILDSDGLLDAELEPKIAPDDLKRLYRGMVLGRRLDERMLKLQRQGRIGTFAPIKGQEASQIGTVFTLEARDWMVPSFRETAAMLWRGWPIEKILAFYAGRLEGGQPGPEQRDLPVTIPVATQLPHAVGLAYGIQYRGEDSVVMVYFGDGATSEGDFHEAANFAGVWHGPVVFVCQNNQWAISVPLKKQTNSRTIAQKAIAYGFPGIQVDGNDVLAVYAASREAVDRARAGGRADADRMCHLSPGHAHHRRRPDQVPLGGRGQGLGAEGSAHALPCLPGEEEAVRRFRRRAGGRGDRPWSRALRGHAAPLIRWRCSITRMPSCLRTLAAERAEVAARLRAPGGDAGAGSAEPASPPMRGQRRTSRWTP